MVKGIGAQSQGNWIHVIAPSLPDSVIWRNPLHFTWFSLSHLHNWDKNRTFLIVFEEDQGKYV